MLTFSLALALVACGAVPTSATNPTGTPSAPAPGPTPGPSSANLTLIVQGPPSASVALWQGGVKVSQPSVSGQTVLTLTRGLYRVEALDVAGYTTPATLNADLSSGNQTLTVQYTKTTTPAPTPTPTPAPQKSTLTIRVSGVTSAPVTVTRAGVTVWSGTVGGSQSLPNLDRALYTVVPGAVSGHTAPAPTSADLSAGDGSASLAYTAVAPAPTPTPPPAGDFEAQVLALVNQARAVARTCGGTSFAAAGPLSANPQLRTAAYLHSKDMAVRGFFSHTNPDGQSPEQRVAAAGYTGRPTAENIAAGQATPQAVVAGWLTSAGHCANIMAPGSTEIGIGYSAGGSYGHYWTQDFGAR